MTNPASNPTEMSLEQCRAEYRSIRRRSHAENNAAFDRAVYDLMVEWGESEPETAEPWQWVSAARAVRFSCRRCAGTGIWAKVWTWDEAGRTVPAPYQVTGVCFRCEGRGFQDDADARRNFGADCYAIVRACGGT